MTQQFNIFNFNGNVSLWLLFILKILIVIGLISDIIVIMNKNNKKKKEAGLYLFCVIVVDCLLLYFELFAKVMLLELFKGSFSLALIIIIGNILIVLGQSGWLDFLILTDIIMHSRDYKDR